MFILTTVQPLFTMVQIFIYSIYIYLLVRPKTESFFHSCILNKRLSICQSRFLSAIYIPHKHLQKQ